MDFTEYDTTQVINLPKDNVFPASQVSLSDVCHARRLLVAGKDSLSELVALVRKIQQNLTSMRDLAGRLGADGATPFTRRPRAAESMAHYIEALLKEAHTLRQFANEVNNDIDEVGQYLSQPVSVFRTDT